MPTWTESSWVQVGRRGRDAISKLSSYTEPYRSESSISLIRKKKVYPDTRSIESWFMLHNSPTCVYVFLYYVFLYLCILYLCIFMYLCFHVSKWNQNKTFLLGELEELQSSACPAPHSSLAPTSRTICHIRRTKWPNTTRPTVAAPCTGPTFLFLVLDLCSDAPQTVSSEPSDAPRFMKRALWGSQVSLLLGLRGVLLGHLPSHPSISANI